VKKPMKAQMTRNFPDWNDNYQNGSLPRWEDLPGRYQQELIQTLATLWMHQPELKALLEVPHDAKR
jgi:hypothetical protein